MKIRIGKPSRNFPRNRDSNLRQICESRFFFESIVQVQMLALARALPRAKARASCLRAGWSAPRPLQCWYPRVSIVELPQAPRLPLSFLKFYNELFEVLQNSEALVSFKKV